MGARCYDVLNESGDVALRIRGRDLRELVSCATQGFAHLVTNPAGIRPDDNRVVEIPLPNATGVGVGELVVQWLNELVFLMDAQGFLALRTEGFDEGSTGLAITLGGTRFNPAVHESRLLVKAATYHDLSETDAGTHREVVVTLDI